MADFVKRRTATAEAKIAQAEAQASAEVRAAAVDAAIKASERVLRDEITGARPPRSLTSEPQRRAHEAAVRLRIGRKISKAAPRGGLFVGDMQCC